MAACLAFTTPSLAADFTVSGSETTTQTLNADNDTGRVTATGSIAVTSQTGDAVAVDLPVQLDGITVENSGSISATSTNDDAVGVRAEVLGDSTVTSTGSITLTAGDHGYGVLAEKLDNADVVNSGTIRITGREGAGVSVTGSTAMVNDARVENSVQGEIHVRGTWGKVSGIKADSLASGAEIVNAGIIDVGATQGGDVYGIRVENYLDDDASISNSGTIRVETNNNGGSSSGFGVYAYYGIRDTSQMTNSGSISVTHNSSVDAYGMSAYYAKDASVLENSGQITMETRAGTHSGDVTGLYVCALTGTSAMKNSGTIRITQNNNGDVRGMAVDASASATTVENSGTIVVSSNGVGESVGIKASGSIDSVLNTGTVEALNLAGELDGSLYSVKTQAELVHRGTLKGRLATGDLDNSGEIRLPTVTSTITGDFTHRAGGVLGITLDSDETVADKSYSKLNVTGSTVLEDGSTIDVDVTTASAHQRLLVGESLEQVISSTGGITADTAALQVTDNSILLNFTPTLSSGNTSLDLNIVQAMDLGDAARNGGNPSAGGPADVLDDLSDNNDPDVNDLLDHLNTLPDTNQVSDTLAGSAPVSSTQTPSVTSQVLDAVGNAVQNRQQSLLGISSGEEFFATRNFWVKPFGSKIEQDDVDGVNGFSATTYGVGMGTDTTYAVDKTVGFAWFYNRAEVDANGLDQKSELDVVNFMLYGSRPIQGLFSDLLYQVGGGFQFTDSTRRVPGINRDAKSDYTAHSAFFRLKASRTYMPETSIQLNTGVALRYAYLYTPGHTETGAGGLNLTVDSFDSQSMVTALEGDAVWSLNRGVELVGSVSVGYDLMDDSASTHASFQAGGDSFVTNGIDDSPLIYAAGIGVVKSFSDTFSLDTRYDFEGRGDSFQSHMVSAKFNWEF